VDGTTLITQGDKGETCKRYSAVYIPPNHAADSKQLDVILWLHGWEISKVEDIFAPSNKDEITSLRESVYASKKDVVLIAPWLGYKYLGGGSLGLGDLGAGNGCGDYLHDVLNQIALYQSKSSSDQKSSDASTSDQSKSGGGVTPTRACRIRRSSTDTVYLPILHCGASVYSADRRVIDIHVGNPILLVLFRDRPEDKAGVPKSARAFSLRFRQRGEGTNDLVAVD
jgi:hypothetical protein